MERLLFCTFKVNIVSQLSCLFYRIETLEYKFTLSFVGRDWVGRQISTNAPKLVYPNEIRAPKMSAMCTIIHFIIRLEVC